jgi:hypothetical protein
MYMFLCGYSFFQIICHNTQVKFSQVVMNPQVNSKINPQVIRNNSKVLSKNHNLHFTYMKEKPQFSFKTWKLSREFKTTFLIILLHLVVFLQELILMFQGFINIINQKDRLVVNKDLSVSITYKKLFVSICIITIFLFLCVILGFYSLISLSKAVNELLLGLCLFLLFSMTLFWLICYKLLIFSILSNSYLFLVFEKACKEEFSMRFWQYILSLILIQQIIKNIPKIILEKIKCVLLV